MPILKRRKMVTEAINSIFEQNGINNDSCEIILVDDETNKTRIENNKGYYENMGKNIRYFLNKNEEGPGGGRQTGMDLAKGKYLLFLDSDDRLTSNYLEKMNNVISDSNSVAVLCLSKSIFENNFDFALKIKIGVLRFVRDLFLLISYILNDKKLYLGAFYLPQFSHMLFNYKFIKDIKFNYDYRRGGEDWDFFAKSLLRGNVSILPERLLLFRYSTGSSTSNRLNLHKKWESYRLLAKRLPKKFKSSFFYKLFKMYINSFSHL